MPKKHEEPITIRALADELGATLTNERCCFVLPQLEVSGKTRGRLECMLGWMTHEDFAKEFCTIAFDLTGDVTITKLSEEEGGTDGPETLLQL